MNLIDQYKATMAEAWYTTDPMAYVRLASDVRQMWDIWNRTQFGGELAPIPVFPTDDTSCLGVDGERGTLVRGCYLCRVRVILIDTTACVLDAKSGLGATVYHHVAETLLHEMVHQWCDENGIEDTDGDGTHNARFRDAARAHGLVCHQSIQGYNSTHVRRGQWRAFYDLATCDLAWRMKTTHERD